MSAWIKIALQKPAEAKKSLRGIRASAEAKGVMSGALAAEWAASIIEATCKVRVILPEGLKDMTRRKPDHLVECRNHIAWQLRQLGLSLSQIAGFLGCERTAVSHMAKRYDRRKQA